MYHDLKRSERAILAVLDHMPDKTVTFGLARKGAHLSPRGFGIALRRLEEANCVARVDVDGESRLTITFGGLRAIGRAA